MSDDTRTTRVVVMVPLEVTVEVAANASPNAAALEYLSDRLDMRPVESEVGPIHPYVLSAQHVA